MNSNNQKKLWVGLFIALIALVSGISYAYFTASFQNLGTRETSITLAELGSLKLTAEEATYTSGNQYPGDMAIQKFYVEPVSKGKGVYELDLTGVIDETIFGSDVEIQLYKSIDNTEVTVTEGDLTQSGTQFSRVDTLVTNGLTPIYNKALKNGLNILYQEEFEVIEESGSLKVRENSTSTSYPKYTFYLVYNYKNNGNQNNQMGQTFTGTISGKLIDSKTLSNSHTATFVMTTTNAGTDSCENIIRAYYEDDELTSLYNVSCDTLQETEQITSGYDFVGNETTDINEILFSYTMEKNYYVNTENISELANVTDDTVLKELNYNLTSELAPYESWENYSQEDYENIDYDVVLYNCTDYSAP